MKIQGTIESVKPIAAVRNLNEVHLVGDARKFTIFDKTDRVSGQVLWVATSMQPGESYEFDYEQKANAKNPQFPYHNLSHPNNITGASITNSTPPVVAPPENEASVYPIGQCPHCGNTIAMEFHKA